MATQPVQSPQCMGNPCPTALAATRGSRHGQLLSCQEDLEEV